MPNPSEEQLVVCWSCVKDAFLQKWIMDNGSGKKCSFCGKERGAIDLPELSDHVHEVFQDHYMLTPDSPSVYEYHSLDGWWRDGDEPELVISEMLGASDKIADCIVEYLSELHGFIAVKDGEENPYGDEARYELRPVPDHDFRETWEYFCLTLQEHSRFFNEDAEQALDEIFEGITDHKTWEGERLFKKFEPDAEEQKLYRARVAYSTEELARVLTRPDLELAAPPSAKARAGRMNASGVSVFYGAFSPKACISELRPPVGSHVVIGTFEIIQTLRLLDMHVLENILVEISHFSPEYDVQMGRAAFLRRFTSELAKPILPDDEEFGYLPTQAVSEYISEKVNAPIDGIIYPSTQAGNGERNIVLFHMSSRVEKWKDAEDKEVKIDWGWATEDDHDDSITVWEQTESEDAKAKPTIEKNTGSEVLAAFAAEWGGDADDYRPPKLRLARDGVTCHRITAANFETSRRFVSRFEEPEDEGLPF